MHPKCHYGSDCRDPADHCTSNATQLLFVRYERLRPSIIFACDAHMAKWDCKALSGKRHRITEYQEAA